MMSQWDRAFRALLATAAIAAAQPAAAVDAVATPLPAPVTDSQVKIGPRSLTLPPGQWTLVARSEGHVKNGTQVAQTHFTVYAMQAEAGALRAGVITRLPTHSARVDAASDGPCMAPDGSYAGLLHRQDFEAGRHCLLVFRHRSHLQGRNLDPFLAQAADSGVTSNGPVYEFSYARYASNDFGWVRVIVPVSTFGSQAAAVAWAQQLPPALGELLEHRTTQAVLPALPNGSH